MMTQKIANRIPVFALTVFSLTVATRHSVAQGLAPEKKTLVYDVSTIKPNNTGSGSISISINDETIYATNVTVKMMLQNSFGVREDIIYGLPGWAGSKHYDIVAKVSDADAATLKALTRDDRKQMMMQLVTDRFRLKSHIEVKELPTFDLVVAKGGPKFQETPKNAPEDKRDSMNVNNTEMTGYGVQMLALTKMLEGQVERNVVDKTGLTGNYDLHLKWRREEDGPTSGTTDEPAPYIYTALQEQLGLKLQPSKGPVDTLVIDHIEEPTEN
jgi:uncharacterized protein (TIGR03435 family)